MENKIYLAGSYAFRDEIQKVRLQLEELGYEITSRWLTEHDGSVPMKRAAKEDLQDVDRAEALVLFTAIPEGGITGGREVEFGYAMATNKPTYIVGGRVNVFHHLLPEWRVFASLDSLYEHAKRTKVKVHA